MNRICERGSLHEKRMNGRLHPMRISKDLTRKNCGRRKVKTVKASGMESSEINLPGCIMLVDGFYTRLDSHNARLFLDGKVVDNCTKANFDRTC